jgi:glycosyltransferase involved in cell wall biosynthesis
MRISIIVGPFLPVPPLLGGAVEKAHFLLAGAYAAAGHDVTMISREYGDLPAQERAGGVTHIRIPSFERADALAKNLATDAAYALRAARRLPPSDITVTNSFSLPLLLPRRRAGKIYVHVARFPKGQMRLYGRADRLQAISQAVADAIVAQAPRLADRVVSIGYPVPEQFFSAPSGAREATVLYVGRIAREKGIHLLIQAFADLLRAAPEIAGGWTLRIVGPHAVAQGGDGEPYLSELRALAHPLGDAVAFAGPVFDAAALAEEYARASIFVYPSIAERGEAFGLSALEAMASGCATVVSGLRCFDDFVRDGASALRFAHRGPAATADLQAQLAALMSSADLRGRIATGGRAAAEEFRLAAISAKMLADFERLRDNPPH